MVKLRQVFAFIRKVLFMFPSIKFKVSATTIAIIGHVLISSFVVWSVVPLVRALPVRAAL